jgi:hypothetical protein
MRRRFARSLTYAGLPALALAAGAALAGRTRTFAHSLPPAGQAAAADAATRLLRASTTAASRAMNLLPGRPGEVLITAAALAVTAIALGVSYAGERGRRTSRAHRQRTPEAGALDVVSPAGTGRVALRRDRAQAVMGSEGSMVAQVVWSSTLGWCATAPWPYHLYGPDGRPCRTLALPADQWVRVAGVRLRLYAQAGDEAQLARAVSDS